MEWYETPENKLSNIQQGLRITSMLLSKYSYDPPEGVQPFKTTQEMAKYFKLLIDTMLPEELRYKESPQKSSD